MPRFAANLTTLFTELPLTERFAAAARAGFKGVEVLFPYDDPVPALLDLIQANGLTLVLINAPPPNYTERPRGFAAVPGGQARFRQDFTRALRVARLLRAQHLHLMSGVASGPEAQATLIQNLRWAAAEAPDQSLTIEPINPVDMPGYFLNDFALALEVLDQVAAPNLHLQFDAYHAQRITGDVMATWAQCQPHVAHVQIAGVPGRHEPTGGDINWPAFFARLDRDGYKGWVSAEYFPASTTEQGLGWLPRP
jgi:2-dehydrotetronate isomerase